MRGRLFGAAISAALIVFVLPAMAQEKRVALVIGNAAYKEAPLKNPVNDARLMAAKLKDLGFEVIAREDATRAQMASAVGEFVGKLNPGVVALVYYAGHGIQSRGKNFMIPVDAALNTETDLRYQAVELTGLMEDIEQAQTRVNIVVIDACRNNPFERRMRGGSRGLAAIDAARGSLIAYATAPGSVAADGDGANAPYTEELVKALAVPNLKAEEVFKRVTAAVEDRSKGTQTPWISSSLRGDFVFNLNVTVAPSVAAPGAAAVDRETVLWQSVERSNRPEEYEIFLSQFPKGVYAPFARSRMDALKKSPQLAAAPAPSALPARPEIAIEAIDKEYAATQTARVREAPDVKSKQLGLLKEGDTLLVLGKVKGQAWYQVERKGEAPAYVSAGLLEEAVAFKKRKEDGQRPQQAPQQAMVAPTPVPAAPGGALPAPGRSFRDCPDCPEMVVIPAGSFDMGSNSGNSNEKPVHRVSIPRAFAIGKFEVTFAEWDACVAAGGCSHRPVDGGWGRGNRPVMNVSWDDAQKYAQWLSRRTGKPYRLPSEAEWEYVAKEGGSSDIGGDSLDGRNQANCYGCGSQWDNRQTAPVGSFAPNRFGVNDMLGNVWEWVEDCYSGSYSSAPSNGTAWLSGNCSERVLRGGSWSYRPWLVRSAFRNRLPATYRYNYLGFRLARTN